MIAELKRGFVVMRKAVSMRDLGGRVRMIRRLVWSLIRHLIDRQAVLSCRQIAARQTFTTNDDC